VKTHSRCEKFRQDYQPRSTAESFINQAAGPIQVGVHVTKTDLHLHRRSRDNLAIH
jgi:hypothetical protein